MDFGFSKEELEVKARARSFVEEVCRPLEDSWGVNDYDVPLDTFRHVVTKFHEYGLRGITVPKEAGGLGLGTMAKVLALEEIARTRLTQGNLATSLLEPHPALYSAPDWQKEKYLYPLVHQGEVFHLHISEPDAGSDAARIGTRAVRDGDSYVINGLKRWGPPPGHPGLTPKYIVCYAVTEPGKGHEGISVFLIDYPNPGLRVVKEYETYAEGAQLGRCADFEYVDCVVPARNMLGSPNMGFHHMMDQLNRNRTVIGARLGATARWAQEQAIRRAKERVTFGRPLAERQAIQWMLAENEIDIEQIQLMSYKAAWMIDQGLDARREAAMLKCFAPVAAARVIDRTMQIHGGLGLVKETRLGELYFISRISQVAEGSTEMMKMTIAREALRRGPN